MKKIILMIAMIFTLASCQSQDDKVITFGKLPSKAQTFIKSNFSNLTILQVTKDKDLFDADYSVYFNEGSKIEFNKKGDWKDIQMKSGVPTQVLHSSIKDFITKNHAGAKVIEISKDKKEYDVKLDNSVEIIFNLSGVFLRYDD